MLSRLRICVQFLGPTQKKEGISSWHSYWQSSNSPPQAVSNQPISQSESSTKAWLFLDMSVHMDCCCRHGGRGDGGGGVWLHWEHLIPILSIHHWTDSKGTCDLMILITKIERCLVFFWGGGVVRKYHWRNLISWVLGMSLSPWRTWCFIVAPNQ